MAIYTGNNGRVYIARKVNSGLSGVITRSIAANQSVARNQTVQVVTVAGIGTGAQFRAGSAISATDSSRSCNFTAITGGSGYAAGDQVYLAKNVSNTLVRLTSNIVLTSANITEAGVDSEAELSVDTYRVAKIRDWSYNSNSEVVETTALGDVTKTYAPSITSGDGTATLMFYEDDLNASGVGTAKDIYELVDLLFPRDVAPRVIMTLAVDGGTYLATDGAELYKSNFTFNAYITSASVSVSYGEVVAVSTSFTVDGPLIDVPFKTGVTRL
jgi:hypothetical protein